MNQTVTQAAYVIPTTRSKAPGLESLLGKIVARLKTISINHRRKAITRTQHQSFMDANLLDDAMGPEISRTLRR